MTADGSAEQAADEVLIEARGSLAVITLNRPRALNALTTAMRAKLAGAFPRFAREAQTYCVVVQSASEKAFSAGGDVREMVRWGREDRARAKRAFADEYALNWLLECFSKPTISLIDGPVMGSGVGISLFGTHRVAEKADIDARPHHRPVDERDGRLGKALEQPVERYSP